jgi:hypothetical protein
VASKKKLTPAKARKILREGVAQGKKLTKRQKGFFGLIAGGGLPNKPRRRQRKRRSS